MLVKFIKNQKWTTATWLGIILPIMGIEWISFKCLYPYADFFTDSYSYIQAAAHHDAISFRPIGYSLFLRLVHFFFASDTLVVTLQYILVQGACLGLVLSLRRWCTLGERTVGVLMAFLILNPTVPYVCNYISSDALLIGLSLIWLTVLMGLLRDPGWWRLGLQVLLLFMIFNVRYVALFYPAVASLAVLLASRRIFGSGADSTRRGWTFAIVGVVASVGALILGTTLIKTETKRATGANLFSAFSGWQMANNVLNLYPRIPVDTIGFPSAESQELAGYVRDYFRGEMRIVADSIEIDVGSPETTKEPAVTTAYMWLRTSPLHQFMRVYREKNRLNYWQAWNRVGVVFSQYGYFVARKHPVAFIRYYGWPSAKTFFWPDLDVFAVYNGGRPEADELAKRWFHYPGLQTKVYSATMQAAVFAPMPALYCFLNIAFAGVVLSFFPFKAVRERDKVFTGSFRLATAFLLANAFFSIFASPSVLRYQVLPIILLVVFGVCGSVLVFQDFFRKLRVKSANDATV
jgi:hypothetical protein